MSTGCDHLHPKLRIYEDALRISGGLMTEQIIDVDGIELCTSSFGDPTDPPILLIMGIGASMLWWDEGFCRLFADGGRFVVRYDHRDTGRSSVDPPGRPSYSGKDLVADALRVLDAYEIEAAHLVGASAGGAFAQLLALDDPDRVRSLVLISTSPAVSSGGELPGPTEQFRRFVGTVEVDWSNRDSVIDYLVAYQRVLGGTRRSFDEPAARKLVQRDVDRAHDFTAARNHDLLQHEAGSVKPLSSIDVPALIIHGTADPMFPIEHAHALAHEIRGATVLVLEGAGHGVERADWQTIADAILDHTATSARSRSTRSA